MTYPTCHTILREILYAVHSTEARPGTTPLAARPADRAHQDFLRHQADRGKHRGTGRPLPGRGPVGKARKELQRRRGPEAAWPGRLSTTRRPSGTSRNSIAGRNARFWTIWRSGLAGPKTSGRSASRFATANSDYGGIACATIASFASS